MSSTNFPNFCVLTILFYFVHYWCLAMANRTVEQCYFRNATTHPSNRSESDDYPELIQNCTLGENDKTHFCFVLWQNSTEGKTEVKMKGCFLHSNECSDTACVGKTLKKELMFCCCKGQLCNKDFWWGGIDPAPTTPSSIPAEKTSEFSVSPFLLTLLPVCILAIAFICFYWFYRRKKTPYFNEVPTFDTHGAPPSPNMGFRPIQLLEVKAKGRFGAVWKAQLKSDTVAVKIFPVQDKQSWLSEQQIYKLPHMRHDNILRFIGVENHKDSLHNEFWLITAYHDYGSLCDFLKANTLTWNQMCRIAETMSRGLMHLHEEMAPTKTENHKPAIAHRDFKSKNVLLKSDMTACVADFGLALVFQLGKPCGDTHGQVGTRRYMAPEVLEGAINFSRDAFLRIDMYACGLILWELASRCTSHDGTVGEYQLPFEEEVGQHPTLEDMQECVVHKKQRPALKASWKKHPGLQALCDTMEECWDHDAEARLSASCVMERIASLSRLTTQPLLINDPNLMSLCVKFPIRSRM